MSNFQKELLTVVEVDFDACPLTFGTSPCSAALSGSTVRKCFNTFASCEDTDNYQRTPETSLTADSTWEPLDEILNGDVAGTSDLFFAVDLTFPADAAGCIWEIGGATSGLYLGVSDGEIVFRIGDGASDTDPDTAKIAEDVSALEGRKGTLYGTVDVSAQTVALYFWDPKVRGITVIGTATASGALPGTAWAGTGVGAFGRVNGATSASEDTSNFNGTLTELRIYDSTLGPLLTNTYHKTFRYSYNQEGLPKGQTIFPAIRSISTNETRINPNGIDGRYGAMGKRGKISITFQDFTDSDTFSDPYQAGRVDGTAQTDEGGYDPKARGTHFTKLRHRSPYYIGRALRVKDGAVGDDIASMRTRHYVISDWKGPDSSGKVVIEAKDVLDLADDKKALCPKPRKGELATSIGTGLVSFDLAPADIGADYPESGRAIIGSEIISFTRATDTITLTGRGLDGSQTASHNAGDSFQDCYHVSDTHVLEVLADLLKNYTGIPATFVPADHWAEELTWLGGYNLTATIPKPTGVNSLLAEISQLGLMVWWDAVAQQVRVKSVRPSGPNETIPAYDEDNTVIAGSISVMDEPNKRLTQVRVYHGMTNAADGVKDSTNYDVLNVHIDEDAEGNAQYAQIKDREIYMRWLGPGQSSIAAAIASRLVARYRDTPRTLKFSADAKDRANLWVAELGTMESRLLVDATGKRVATPFQVIRFEETQAGHVFEIEAENFAYQGRFGYVMQNSANDYGSATDAEKELGFYIVDPAIGFPDGTDPYQIF
ncbi:MAG: hypothetical protein ACPG4X_18635 [Pikeienuella sp.]